MYICEYYVMDKKSSPVRTLHYTRRIKPRSNLEVPAVCTFAYYLQQLQKNKSQFRAYFRKAGRAYPLIKKMDILINLGNLKMKPP